MTTVDAYPIRADDKSQWIVYRNHGFEEVLGFFPDLADAQFFVKCLLARDVIKAIEARQKEPVDIEQWAWNLAEQVGQATD